MQVNCFNWKNHGSKIQTKIKSYISSLLLYLKFRIASVTPCTIISFVTLRWKSHYEILFLGKEFELGLSKRIFTRCPVLSAVKRCAWFTQVFIHQHDCRHGLHRPSFLKTKYPRKRQHPLFPHMQLDP